MRGQKSKIGKAVHIPGPVESFAAEKVKTVEIKDSAVAYDRNMERANLLLQVPVGAMYYGSLLWKFAIVDPIKYPEGVSSEESVRIIQEAYAIHAQRELEEFSRHHESGAVSASSEAQESLNLATHRLEALDALGQGFQTIMSSQLIGLWTAYEALATDLWVASVNAFPSTLGMSALLAPKRKMEGESAEGETKKKNPISLDDLQEYGFDLKSRLGEMLWRRRWFDLNSVEGIRFAYHQTFSLRGKKAQHKATPAAVKNWFTGTGTSELSDLEAIRHILVHRGGRPDKPFFDRVKQNGMLSAIQKDRVIRLDGEMVALYTLSVRACSERLLYGVDQWFQSAKKT